MLRILYPLATVFLWAVNTVVSRAAAGRIAPGEISFLRWVLAAAILTPIAGRAAWRQRAAMRQHASQVIVLGLLGMVAYQCLAYYAAYHTSATHMGIISALGPAAVLALSVPLLGQRLTARAVAGCALALAGVLVIVGAGAREGAAGGNVLLGDALMLAALLCYALYIVLLRRWPLAGITPLALLYAQALVSVVALAPLYAFSPRVGINGANLPLVLYAGIGASIVAPLLWMLAIAANGPARAAMYMNLMPLFTVLLAAAALGEHLAPYHALGGLLTVAGVLLAEWPRRPARPSAAPAQAGTAALARVADLPGNPAHPPAPAPKEHP